MEITESIRAQDPTDEMILHVLVKYQMHLSARSISRTISRIYGEDISPYTIALHLRHVPCKFTDTNIRKYSLKT
jgi:repressor of nif and glnA expression